ncbi:MAG: type VI secretion system ATPase TssH, partial [Marinilabiliales bacterium]
DEIEKAHPDVFNILLQVLDDGRMTDNKGRLVDFKNTIIIMTSNVGSHIIQEQLANVQTEDSFEQTRLKVMEELKRTIRPEFLNRIDEIIMFTPLTEEQIKEVVRLQFSLLQKTLQKQQVTIEITDSAIDLIASKGFDPQYGARPVKRVIQKQLLNELSKKILSGDVSSDAEVFVDVDGDELIFTNQK